MRATSRVLFVSSLLLAQAWAASAQTPADISGHWAGTIEVQQNNLSVDVDLVKNSRGEFVGAVSIPSQNVKGMALTKISVAGRAVSFQILDSVPGDNVFKGEVSPTGKMLTGAFTHDIYTMNFSLNRTGDAVYELPPPGTAITKELEGSWSGTLDIPGKALRVVVKLSNQPGGEATGTLVSVDQGGLEIPVSSVVQSGSAVTLDVRNVGGIYKGTVSADGAELVGTWTQGGGNLPLTLRRDVGSPKP